MLHESGTHCTGADIRIDWGRCRFTSRSLGRKSCFLPAAATGKINAINLGDTRCAAFLFSDDCNHDVAGLYAVSFEQEIRGLFPGPRTLEKLPGLLVLIPCDDSIASTGCH